VVVGDKEVESEEVNIRRYGSKETATLSATEFVAQVIAEVNQFSRPIV